MSGYTELVQAVKRAAIEAVEAEKPCDVMFGEVVSVEPLQVFVEIGVLLEEEELIVGEHLTHHIVEMSFESPEVKQRFVIWDMEEEQVSEEKKLCLTTPVRHRVRVYAGLRTGDKVILLRRANGQQFLILDRMVSA